VPGRKKEENKKGLLKRGESEKEIRDKDGTGKRPPLRGTGEGVFKSKEATLVKTSPTAAVKGTGTKGVYLTEGNSGERKLPPRRYNRRRWVHLIPARGNKWEVSTKRIPNKKGKGGKEKISRRGERL